MNWKLSFILVISMNQVWSHPYGYHQQHPPDQHNDWRNEQQQESESYEYPHYTSYDHSYQSPQNLDHFQNQHQQQHLPPNYFDVAPTITDLNRDPSSYQDQASNNEEIKMNQMDYSQQNYEYSPTHSSQLLSTIHHHNIISANNQYHQGQQKSDSLQLINNFNTNSHPKDSDFTSQDHIHQREYVQKVDTFYKDTDKYQQTHEIRQEKYNQIPQYQDQISDQESEPSDQQSTLEFQYQHEDKTPNKYTQATEASAQQYNIEFGSQKQLEKPNQYIESGEFGLHSDYQFRDQEQQTPALPALGEHQSNIEYGYQQQEQRLSKFQNSQVTDNFGQQSDSDFGSHQHEQQTIDKYTNTQENEALLHQQTSYEFDIIHQEEKPNILSAAQRTERFKHNLDPEFESEEQVQISERSTNYHDSQQLEQEQFDLTIGIEQNPNQYNDAQETEQLVQQESNLDQHRDQKIKYTNLEYTVPLEQYPQVPNEKMNNQQTEMSGQQFQHQSQEQQEHEELEQQSILELGSEQEQSSKNYFNHQVFDSMGEKLSKVDFGSMGKPNEFNDEQKTGEFDKQSNQQLMSQQQQIPDIYADTPKSLEDQTTIENLHEQEQRPNKYTVSMDGSQQHIGQTSGLEFGSQYQDQSFNNHFSDHDGVADGVDEQQSNMELGFQEQIPGRYNDDSEIEQFEQQSTNLDFVSQQDLKADKKIDVQLNYTMVEEQTNTEFGSQEEEKQNYNNKEQETGETIHETDSQLVQNFHSLTLEQNSQDVTSGSLEQELTPNTYPHSEIGKNATQQQKFIELDSMQQYRPNNYIATQETEQSAHQSLLGFGSQQVLISKNNNNQDVDILDEQQSNIEFGSQQLEQNSSELNDKQEIEGFGQQSIQEFGYQQVETSKNYSNIDYDHSLDKQQSNIEFGFQQQKPINTNYNQETEQGEQQSNLAFGYQQQYQNTEDLNPLVDHQQALIEVESKQEQNQNGYSYQKETDQIVQQSDLQLGALEVLSQNEESLEQQSNIDVDPHRLQQNPKIYTFPEETGQQSDLVFGFQQQEHKPNKYTDTQRAETPLNLQTNTQFGFQEQQKPLKYNSELYSDSVGNTQFVSKDGAHDNKYSNFDDIQTTDVSQKHLKVNIDSEKDPYECLNVKVDELEKELSSNIDAYSTTSSSRQISQLNTNTNYPGENNTTNESNIYEQQTNKIEHEHISEISITIKPEVIENVTMSSPKNSFWQKIQNKMSETYTKVQNKATDIVEKVKNKISAEN